MKKQSTGGDLDEAILGLFKDDDEVLLILPGDDTHVLDLDPAEGLRLAVNCVCIGYAEPCQDEAIKQRQAKVKNRLKKLATKATAWFVIGYHLRGSNEYSLAWSDDLDGSQAANVVLGYIQYLTRIAANDMGEPPDSPFPLSW
jgi:hypothetical protein